jgi:hypothetical protein
VEYPEGKFRMNQMTDARQGFSRDRMQGLSHFEVCPQALIYV